MFDSINDTGTLLRGDELIDWTPFAPRAKPRSIYPALERRVKPEPAARHVADSFMATLARLRVLRRYRKGWDGPGTFAACERSFELAESFLDLLSRFSTTFLTDATIYAPGTAVLTVTSGDFVATIEFAPDGALAINIDDCEGEHDLDLCGFDGTRIPHKLARFLAYPVHIGSAGYVADADDADDEAEHDSDDCDDCITYQFAGLVACR